MSIDSIAVCWAHSQAPSQAALLVLLAIAEQDGEGGSYPGVEKLAKRARIKRESARQIVRKLEQLGEIRTHINDGGGIHTQKHMRTNLYEVLIECPWYCDRTREHRDLRLERFEHLRPPHWALLVSQYEPESTPPVATGGPCGDRGGPPVGIGPNHPITTQDNQDTSSNLSLVDMREEENTPVSEVDQFDNWHPHEQIAKAAAAVAATKPVKRPDLSKASAPIATAPPAPHIPRYRPPTPPPPEPPRSAAEEAAAQAASELVCPEGFGGGRHRLHWFPGTLTGCARCGAEALDLVSPPLLDQEAPECQS